MNRTRLRGRSLGPLLLVCVSFAACVTPAEGERPSPPLTQPPVRQSAEQETLGVVGAVQKSGDVPADIQPILFRAAEAAFVQTFGAEPALARVERGGCFAGGCLFFLTFQDRCAELAFKQKFSEMAHTRLHSWPGPVYRSPAIKSPDGRIHQTWALLLAETPDRRARLEALLQPAPALVGAIRPDVCASVNPAPTKGNNPAPQGVK